MERVLSVDERIRRAEEIYYRRKNDSKYKSQSKIEDLDSKKEKYFVKKMILQILICITIYIIFYLIKNTNYIFSEEVLKKTNEILSYDINITSIYEGVKEYFNSFLGDFKTEDNIETESEEGNELKEDLNNEQTQETIDEDIKGEENIGGEEIENTQEEVEVISQMEQDARSVLTSNSFIIPLKGTITSRYGERESSNPIVSKYHTGIDIAVNEGTVFIASMEGVVKEVSSIGALGNHVTITNGDVSTVYAHCKTIYVQEGQNINQGDSIGEVGSTGNATGPHLHFEIKKEDRYIDPDYILDFE